MNYLDFIILFVLMIIVNLVFNKISVLHEIKIRTKERLNLIRYLLHKWQSINNDGFYEILLEQESQLKEILKEKK